MNIKGKDFAFGVFLFIFIVAFLFLILTLFYIQIYNTNSDRKLFLNKEEQYRGDIYFTDKDGNFIAVATTRYRVDLIIDPRGLGDIPETYEHINRVIPLDKEVFFKRAKKKRSRYELLKRNVTDEEIVDLEKKMRLFGLTGVHLVQEPIRYYPYGSLASQVIGFVGFNDRHEYGGQYGLEKEYDEKLRTHRPIDETIPELSNLDSTENISIDGSIYTSIDINVQKRLEEVLQDIQGEWSSTKSGGIVVNPKNGQVIAMASLPSFDPNNFKDVKDYNVFINPSVEEVYEIGSTFKPLTVAIGLDSKAITEETTYDDEGFLEIDERTIYNYDKKGRGKDVPIYKILAESLNTGAAFVMLETGINSYRNYMQAFDFGRATGVDLPREIGGLVDNLRSPRIIEYVTASYGHGIAVTPISATKAFSSLANGGYLVTPEIKLNPKRQNSLDVIEEDKEILIFRRETTEKLGEMLTSVFENELLGGFLKNDRYSIASKTGTALLLNRKDGKYFEDRFLHSFFGYLSKTDTTFLVFLFVVDPEIEEGFASDTLARPFSELMDYIISYYAIPPDR